MYIIVKVYVITSVRRLCSLLTEKTHSLLEIELYPLFLSSTFCCCETQLGLANCRNSKLYYNITMDYEVIYKGRKTNIVFRMLEYSLLLSSE